MTTVLVTSAQRLVVREESAVGGALHNAPAGVLVICDRVARRIWAAHLRALGVAILIAPAVLALTALWESAVRAIAPGFSLFTESSVDNFADVVTPARGTSRHVNARLVPSVVCVADLAPLAFAVARSVRELD